ncbi:MAG: DUF1294 domain-containing protein [Bacteroidales bacterium]|nr:DUF1294 domain-containing protein [Bacteroidales bacterium]
MSAIFYYLLFINILSGIFFIKDKWSASHKRKRVSETSLHILEALGGIFLIMILMPAIHHKNKKKSYYLISLLICLSWVMALCLYIIDI